MESLNPAYPLITPYTRQCGIPDATLEKLFKVRTWDIEAGVPLPFKWPTRLRTHLGETPLHLRQYQIQMVHNLVRLSRFICGDGVGLGKTIDAVAAVAWLRDRYPDLKVIVMATKSCTGQWEDEVHKFSTLNAATMQDPKPKKGLNAHASRCQQLKDFLSGTKTDVMICKYTSMIGHRRRIEGKWDADGNPVQNGKERISQEIRDFAAIIKPYAANVILILDECQRFKTVGAQTRNLIQYVQAGIGRVWALTATAIKNGLEEFYSIASAMGIRPFGTMGDFYEHFCLWRKVFIGKGRFKEVISGYKNVAEFKNGMRPFFYGRSQRQVKEPLPRVITKMHYLDLDEAQAKLLLEDIPNGTFVLPPNIVKTLNRETGETLITEKERDAQNEMTLLSIYSLVANSAALLDPLDKATYFSKALSPKEECLLDMLDGDYRGEKMIVFSKFKRHIDRIEQITKNGHFTERKFLRITGNENEAQRNDAKRKFQEPAGEWDLIMINGAATEGVNLQQAAHMVLLDVPWSWGELLQLVGRMVRMASPHTTCMLHILAANGTVDIYAIDTLKGKKGVFEAILGESHSAGILDDKALYDLDAGMEQEAGSDAEFHSLLRAKVRKVSLGAFTVGKQLVAAQIAGGDYVPTADVVERVNKKKGKPQRTPEEDAEEFAQLSRRWS